MSSKGGSRRCFCWSTEIQPGKTPSFDEVKGRIRDRLASRRAPTEIRSMHDQVDDNRLGRQDHLKKSVQAARRDLQKDRLDRAQRQSSRRQARAFESPDQLDHLVSTAYGSSVGVENEVIELTDGGYAWVRVLGVTKPVQAAVRRN